MATVPASISGSPRGIQNTLSGFVIESEENNPTPVQEDFDDQNGARADEKVYDTRTDLNITVYGASASANISSVLSPIANSGGQSITYGGHVYKVDSCREVGTYNGRRRWNIIGHRFDNFPAQPSGQNAQGSTQGSTQGS